MFYHCWTAVLYLAQLIDSVSASTHINSFDTRQTQNTTATDLGHTVPSYNISIPVDHFDSSNNETYENRFWVNDTYYEPGGPVFFYDFGEGGINDELALAYLAEVNRTTSVIRLAEQYHGLAIMWEHRYFGLSLPVPLNESIHEPQGGFSGYRYLTIEQSLEDVAYFGNNFCSSSYNQSGCNQLLPTSTPWIWVGGSYPGLRGAVMRVRNPEVFYAVWSSSAPLQVRYDGSLYYDPIEASMPSNCTTDVRAVVKYADEIMSGEHGAQAYEDLQRLTFVSSVVQSNPNANYNLSLARTYDEYLIASQLSGSIFGLFQTYGPSNTIDPFCSYLESYNPDGVAANNSDPYIAVITNSGDGEIGDQGLTTTYNASVGLNAYVFALNKMFEQLAPKLSNNSIPLQSLNDPAADSAAWSWLVYTAIGWFQGSDPDNITIVSRYYNVSTAYERRAELSFRDISASDFDGQPKVTDVNKYGGWNMSPSNVMFTVGEFDPWRGGTPMSQEVRLGAPNRNVTQDVPMCGQAPPGTDVFGLVLPGAVHIQDMYSFSDGKQHDGTESMQAALSLFTQALDAWLPCFNASQG